MTTHAEHHTKWNSAKALLELIGLAEIPKRLAADMTNKFREQFGEVPEGEELPTALRESVSFVFERLTANTDSLFEKFVDIYAESFTEEQLEALDQFYRGPIGKLLSETNETVQGKIMAASNEWSAEEFKKLSPDLALLMNGPDVAQETAPEPQPSPQPQP